MIFHFHVLFLFCVEKTQGYAVIQNVRRDEGRTLFLSKFLIEHVFSVSSNKGLLQKVKKTATNAAGHRFKAFFYFSVFCNSPKNVIKKLFFIKEEYEKR